MNLGSDVPGLPVEPFCGCATCIEAVKQAELDATGDTLAYLCRYMVLCPTCGNKRCPKATHHGYECSGSNTPGQTGSWYQ